MLKIILNRLQLQAEEIIADEQAGFRAGRSTTEQIHVYSISGSFARNTCSISRISTMSSQTSRRPLSGHGTKPYGQLWGNTTSTPASYELLKICIRPRVQSCSMAAQENVSELQPWVRQRYILSPTLFNIFLERIMCEALDDHKGNVSIGGRLITNFRYADDIVIYAEEEEADVLLDRLDRTTTRYKMEIGSDKTKVMTNNPSGFQREIKIKSQRLEEEKNFKNLGAIISNVGSKPEILSRIAQTTAALSRLKIILRDKNISLASKVKLMQMLILSTFLYACGSWTLTAETESRIQALKMRCYRRLLNISYKDHLTNKEVRNRIQNAIGVHDDLQTMVKKRKLRWYGHISRSSGMADNYAGTVKGARRRGRQKKRWKITSRNGRVKQTKFNESVVGGALA